MMQEVEEKLILLESFCDDYEVGTIKSLNLFFGDTRDFLNKSKWWMDPLDPRNWMILRGDESSNIVTAYFPAVTKVSNEKTCIVWEFTWDPSEEGSGITLSGHIQNEFPLESIMTEEPISPETSKKILQEMKLRYQREFSLFNELTAEMWLSRIKNNDS